MLESSWQYRSRSNKRQLTQESDWQSDWYPPRCRVHIGGPVTFLLGGGGGDGSSLAVLCDTNSAESRTKRPRLMMTDCNESDTDCSSSRSTASSCDPLVVRSDSVGGGYVTDGGGHPILYQKSSSLLSVSSTLTEGSSSEVTATVNNLSSPGPISHVAITQQRPPTPESFDVIPGTPSEYQFQSPHLDSLARSVEDWSLTKRRARRRGNIYSTPSSLLPGYFQYVASSHSDPTIPNAFSFDGSIG